MCDYVCVNACECVHVCVCMGECVHACMCLFVFVCVHLSVHGHTYTTIPI